MGILKVKPWGRDQGDHVLIEEEDFNPDFHVLFDAPEKSKKAKKGPVDEGPTDDELRAALTEKGVAIPDGATKEELQALLDAANEAVE